MSLLLDALKQAEKSKKEQSAEPDEQDKETLKLNMDEVARYRASAEGAGGRDDLSGELSIEPMDGNGAGAVPRGDTDRLSPDSGSFSGELRLSPEESQSLSMDLEKFAQELSEATDNFPPPGFEETGQTGAQSVVGEGSVTMPSIKNVQRSLNDFYGEPTGVMSSPEPAPPDEAPQETSRQAAAEDTGSSTQPSQHAARNVFEAKGSDHGRRTLWLAMGAVVVALLLGGGYLWFSVFNVDPIATQVARSALPRAPLPPRPVPAEVTQTGALTPMPAAPPAEQIDSDIDDPALIARELALATEVQSSSEAAGIPISPSAVMPVLQPEVAATPVEAAPMQDVSAPLVPQLPAKPAMAEAGPTAAPVIRGPEKMAPIRIKRSVRRDRQFAALKQAWQDFQDGDVGAAESAYQKVLRSKPGNRDALLGLAAVSMQDGRTGQARGYYQRMLYLNPQDQAARAGLTTLQGAVDPVAGVSQVKLLLERQPEAPYLHFALGNLYAQQSRWAEAQGAYFNAWNGEPENGDYRFNLAIALDHLNQSEAALKFYRLAVDAANTRTVHFDSSQAYQRIYDLTRKAEPGQGEGDGFNTGTGFQ